MQLCCSHANCYKNVCTGSLTVKPQKQEFRYKQTCSLARCVLAECPLCRGRVFIVTKSKCRAARCQSVFSVKWHLIPIRPKGVIDFLTCADITNVVMHEQIFIHPSNIYTAYPFRGHRGTRAHPIMHFVGGRGHRGGQVSSLSQRKHIHTHRHRGRKRLENMLTPNRTLPHGQGHVAVRRQRHNSRCVCILASVHFILTCLYICSVFKVNRSEPFKKLNHLLGPSFRRSSLQTAPQGFLLFRYKMSGNNHSVAILTIQSHDTFLFTCPVTHIHD